MSLSWQSAILFSTILEFLWNCSVLYYLHELVMNETIKNTYLALAVWSTEIWGEFQVSSKTPRTGSKCPEPHPKPLQDFVSSCVPSWSLFFHSLLSAYCLLLKKGCNLDSTIGKSSRQFHHALWFQLKTVVRSCMPRQIWLFQATGNLYLVCLSNALLHSIHIILNRTHQTSPVLPLLSTKLCFSKIWRSV